MRTALFANTAKSAFNGPRPLIVVDIGQDDPARGDTHGFIGLARGVAEKLGGDMVVVDEDNLALLYPQIQVGENSFHNHQVRLRAFFESKGYPDMLFSKKVSETTLADLKTNGTNLVISSVVEKLSAKAPALCNSRHLVAHHLNSKIMQYEGDIFLQEYSILPRPYIAVLVADSIEPIADSEDLAAICRNYEEATVFVCTSHRAWSDFYNDFMQRFKTLTEDSGLAGRLHIVGYDYKLHQDIYGPNAHYNMYPGLIDQADHVIITGYSSSMVSEVLSTGKVPFVTKDEWYDQMIENGHAARFSDCNPGKVLETTRITPVNITEDLVDYIIQCHRKNAEARPGHGFFGAVRQRPAGGDFTL